MKELFRDDEKLAKASMVISAVVLLTGYLLNVPLSLLIGYMVIATTFVRVGLRCSVRQYRRHPRD